MMGYAFGPWRRLGISVGLGGGGWPTALRNSLVAYWKLDEASGSRADSIGSNTLTDNNTVGSATGLVYPLAADFELDNSESLSITNNATLQTGDVDFWLAAWVKAETLAGNRVIAGKWGVTGDYVLAYDPSSNFNLTCRNAGNTANASASVTLTEATATWYFVVGWHLPSADKIYCSVNNGTPAEAALSGGVRSSTEAFAIGAYNNAAGYWDGLIGPVMLGKGYVPTADDLTWLYNAGAGRTI